MNNISKSWFLGKEYCDYNNINIANSSQMIEDMVEGTDYYKAGNATIIDSNALLLSEYYKKDVKDFVALDVHTDLTSLVSYEYLSEQFDLTKSNVNKLFSPEIVKIGTYTFMHVSDDMKVLFDKTATIIDGQDLSDCLRDNLIDGYMSVNGNKHLVWY